MQRIVRPEHVLVEPRDHQVLGLTGEVAAIEHLVRQDGRQRTRLVLCRVLELHETDVLRIEGLEAAQMQSGENRVTLLATPFARHAVGRTRHRDDEQRRAGFRQQLTAQVGLLGPVIGAPPGLGRCRRAERQFGIAPVRRTGGEAFDRVDEAVALLALLLAAQFGEFPLAVALDGIERVFPHSRVDFLEAAGVTVERIGARRARAFERHLRHPDRADDEHDHREDAGEITPARTRILLRHGLPSRRIASPARCRGPRAMIIRAMRPG